MARTSLLDRRNQRAVPLLLFVLAVLLIAGRIVAWKMESRDGAGEGDLVRWVPLEEAAALAKAQNKPILYDFTADWCAPCHELDAAVFRNARFAEEINERFIPVRVVDREREDGVNDPLVTMLQRRYAVRAFPTVVFADASGGMQQRMEGFDRAERFERLMERIP